MAASLPCGRRGHATRFPSRADSDCGPFFGFSSVSSAMELSGATADSGDRFPFVVEVKYQEKLICSNGAVSRASW
ncbi:hypothetical protein [Methyloceanibacter sp.]|uniref:hypothetical protein n=1 Tax=Methyloceanibacter sp. TaxID=1965321 RepID=UPI00351AB94C